MFIWMMRCSLEKDIRNLVFAVALFENVYLVKSKIIVTECLENNVGM